MTPASFALPRRMVHADLPQVEAIELDVYPFPWTRGNFADSIDSGYSAWVLANEQGLIGYFVVMISLDEAHLLNISVGRRHQGVGAGRFLLGWAEQVSQQAGAATLLLEVRPSNALAWGFYERHGFARIGVRRAYYPAVGGREDAIVMRKPLAFVAAAATGVTS